jgi:tight adherence protein B
LRWYALTVLALLALFFMIRGGTARSRAAARRNLARHIGAPDARENPKGASRLVSALLAKLEKTGYAAKMREAVEVSGLNITPKSFGLLWLFALVSLPSLAVILTGSLLSAPIAALMLLSVPTPILVALRRRQDRRTREQCDRLASDLALFLQCGIPVEEALALCAQDLGPPLSNTFHRFLGEVALGFGSTSALLDLVTSLDCQDLELIVRAAVTSRETGADVRAIMANIGDAVRERAAIRRELHSLTVQGKLSGRIVAGLPFLFLGLSTLISRATLTVILGTVPGIIMLTVAGALDALGFLWIRKILDIKT